MNRSSYHWLNLKATQRSALILLNRKVSPEIRNDDDSQKAAADILQIIILLKKANMMHNPHLIYSPFFIFVAGIEVCDPVYQECTLAILRDLKGWGGNVCKVIQLLQYVTARQEQLDRRIEIGAMMEECGLSMVI